jgi:hypothetical protein
MSYNTPEKLMELVILLSAMLVLVCFWSMLDWHRRQLNMQFKILQDDMQFYGSNLEEKIDTVQEGLSVLTGENIERI